MSFPLLFFAAGCSLFSSAISQSVDDCTATVQIVGTTSAPNQIDIPLGTVCVQCVVNGVVDTATTTFLIGNSPIQGVVDNGVLVVDDTSMTFQASPALTLRCVSGSGGVRQASVYLDVYLPPIITGATTVNEGGTLSLSCDSTNSNREPTCTVVRQRWPDGVFIWSTGYPQHHEVSGWELYLSNLSSKP
ncbi:hypothetical protein GBAR_LOCUS14558 [Geodia barretti]|uniref:Ig-like domain-containing protein n=1 Tax=Geodia barretti TaxID=519541 RepID=A0AA35S7Z7_GEOBA|nr:hypothetical protein GBAR_LOCUS14558 [Geodia barretti]